MRKYFFAVFVLMSMSMDISMTSFVLIPSLQATMVVPMNLSQMTRDAEKIFRGVCTSIETELDENNMPATYIRFQVLEGIKGLESGETVLIKQAGSSKDPVKLLDGEKVILPMKSLSLSSRSYEEGKEYLLFYYPESEWGFTSPVGAGQGLFEVETDSRGMKSVINPLNNRFIREVRRERGLEGASKLTDVTTKVQSLILQNP